MTTPNDEVTFSQILVLIEHQASRCSVFRALRTIVTGHFTHCPLCQAPEDDAPACLEALRLKEALDTHEEQCPHCFLARLEFYEGS